MTRILLIEDDGGTAAEILLELTAAGHDVRHVGSLASAATVLSALGSLDDRVRGLRAGGDDYLPKPFALLELIARVEALLRRPNDTRETRLIVGPLDLDLLAGRATRAGRDLELLPRELKLLDYMVRRPRRIITRSMLLQDVWGYTFEPNTNVVDVHMGRLRRKVDGEGEAPLIRNVRGQGYVFDLH
ncbi:response regulator transcription factor [Sphingomonas sanguinis]|uniref:response regulator transcription factor n=1 Tax=Sphingomonas sanguinis TaxID=33051 RepID=UPI0030182128